MNVSVELAGVALAALLSENLILVRCLGLGTRVKSLEDPLDAWRTGYCLTIVMVFTAWIGWLVDNLVLLPMGMTHLRTLVFTLLALGVVEGLRRLIQTFLPELSRRMDENLSSITTNCAALGVVLLISQRGYGLGAALVFSLCGGIGATVALVSYASLGEEVDLESCPRAFRGVPIRLITIGLMAMGLIGFYGLHLH